MQATEPTALSNSGRGITVYGGSSADSTTDGADTLSITNLYEASTVYGAAGADSFVLARTIHRLLFGSKVVLVPTVISGGGIGCNTTILGGAAADSLSPYRLLPAATSMVPVVLTPWSSQASLALLPKRQPSWVVKVTTPLVQPVSTLHLSGWWCWC